MVKAFIVTFKTVDYRQYALMGSTTTISYMQNNQDERPLMVIANDIKDVAFKYPTAISIIEYEVKDVVILDKVLCPVKEGM